MDRNRDITIRLQPTLLLYVAIFVCCIYYADVAFGNDDRWQFVHVSVYFNCATSSQGLVTCWGDVPRPLEASVESGAVLELYPFGYCVSSAENTTHCYTLQRSDNTEPNVAIFHDVAVVHCGAGACCAVLEGGGLIQCYSFSERSKKLEKILHGAAIQIAVGDNEYCVIEKGQQLQCWTLTDGLHSYSPVGAYRELSVWGNSFCAISRKSGKIKCWNEKGITESDGEAQAISVGANHICYINHDNHLFCSGNNIYGQVDAPTGLFSRVAASVTHNCAINEENEIICWGCSGNDTLGRDVDRGQCEDIAAIQENILLEP